MKGKKTGGRQKGSLNKATADIKSLAEPYGPAAVKKLSWLMVNGESHQVQLAASREILDRCFGKPAQSVSVGGDAENPIVVADITPLETARRIAYLLASGLQNVEEPTNG